MTGFTDAHFTAISVGSLVAAEKINVVEGTLPILLGLTTNTVTKVVIAIVNGGSRYALQVVPGLLLTIGAAWLGWVLQ